MTGAVHHLELWTTDLPGSAAAFDRLLTRLGWTADDHPGWPAGRIWRREGGPYLVLEASPAVTGPHDRMRGGLNHLALRVSGRDNLDRLRAECGSHGWSELFADRYPYAGGNDHVALFIENREGHRKPRGLRGRTRGGLTRSEQAPLTTSTHSCGWVHRKSCGTPGTLVKPPSGTNAASCLSGQSGRMSSPAARKHIGTGQSAGDRRSRGAGSSR